MGLSASEDLGVVVIGRNEGARLVECLKSVVGRARGVVYVDSGSIDGSVDNALALGAIVASLSTEREFTAARARNHGLSVLLSKFPDLSVVQFVDGDCEVNDKWFAAGLACLAADAGIGAVAGQRRERFPHASVYNMICDIEWRSEPGRARYFGGDAMIRVEAIVEAGGYRELLIAGEDPELALRIRRLGWELMTLAEPMTLHDANMISFPQWWLRAKRTGYAYAEGAFIHGDGPERHWVRESRRSLFWTVLPSCGALAGYVALGAAGLFPLLAYPLSFSRLIVMRRKELGLVPAAAWALFVTVGKFPEAIGHVAFRVDRFRKRQAGIIEYK